LPQFHNIKDLFATLNRGEKLVSDLFEKRKKINYKLDEALEIIGVDEDVVQKLIDKGIVINNSGVLELDEQFLVFFEEVLEVNEVISVSGINEQIKQIREEQILLYQNATSESERQKYLKQVKKALQKIGKSIARAIVDLGRNVENTFKTEPNYKNKLVKLTGQKATLLNIELLITQSYKLITEDEILFFSNAIDEEMRNIIYHLKLVQSEARQNIIELKGQVIEYINQIKHNTHFTEHLRKLKYLKDEHEIKHATNLISILQANQDVIFEPKQNASIKLGLSTLFEPETIAIIKKVNAAKKIEKLKVKKIADTTIGSHTNEEEHIFIDHYELKRKFDLSNVHLFQFLQQYKFTNEITFEELVTLYCQMVILFEHDLRIEEEYLTDNNISYSLVYPNTFRL
jgi:hypothetical protein